MWHRQGKVSLIKGSDVVTGAGTNWVENIRVGDGFQGPDGKLYQIINVASNEAMAISPAYEGNTAANLNYWVVPIPGYSKAQEDRLSLIISKLDGDTLSASEAADRADAAADQAQQWRDSASASASEALSEANRSEAEADRAELEADKAQQAADDAVAVTTGGTASIEPEAGKIPIAGDDAAIKQAWVKDLEFELDALRVAKNKALYGDGPYPVIDLQFQGAKRLDPRIIFTRASSDWGYDSDGVWREFGIDEPVVGADGMRVFGQRANLIPNSKNLTSHRTSNATVEEAEILDPFGVRAFKVTETSGEGRHNVRIAFPSLEVGKPFTRSVYVKAGSGANVGILTDKFAAHEEPSRIYIAPSDGEIIVSSGEFNVEPAGGGWYRISVTGWVSDEGADLFSLELISPIGSQSYKGDGESYAYFSAPQLEEGASATSYIPTGNSAVTVAPVLMNECTLHDSTLIGKTFVVRGKRLMSDVYEPGVGANTRRHLVHVRGGAPDQFRFFLYIEGAAAPYSSALIFYDRREGHNTFNLKSGIQDISNIHMAVRVTESKITVAFDGELYSIAAEMQEEQAGSMEVFLGKDNGNTRYLRGDLASFQMYGYAVTDTELLELAT